MPKGKESTKTAILNVASELFYTQGYNATGIQQIINEAKVSKGAFYSHFKTKDELGLLYLKSRSELEMSHLRTVLAEIKDPLERYLQFTPLMKDWVVSSDFRGCAFSNMSAEVPDRASPIRQQAKYHYEEFRLIIKEMIKDLFDADSRLQSESLHFVSDQFLMLQIGALTNAEIYQDVWPYEHTDKAVRALIGLAEY